MAITRSQIPQQIDGKLRGAKGEKKKQKKNLYSKKSNKKNPLSRTFTV
jgi:hypothetical protein